jgi:hypothetical protein
MGPLTYIVKAHIAILKIGTWCFCVICQGLHNANACLLFCFQSSAESLSDLEISIDDGDIPLTKKQVLDAFDSLADSPDDVEAHGIIERFENQEYPPRWNSPEVTAILSLPEHEESAQYLRPLDRDINFHQIYGYLPQKASIMHNIVMRNISIHRGYKRAKGANPRLPHKGVLLHGPSGTNAICPFLSYVQTSKVCL